MPGSLGQSGLMESKHDNSGLTDGISPAKRKKKVFIVRDEDDTDNAQEVEMVETKTFAHSDNDDDNDKYEDGTETELSAKEVWKLPLLFYKTNNPLRRPRKKFKFPLHVRMPGDEVCVGLEARKRGATAPVEEKDNASRFIVFSYPGESNENRSNVYGCLLYFFLLPADFILSTVIFAHLYMDGVLFDDMFVQYTDLDDGKSTLVLSYLCTCLLILLALIGMKLRDTQVLTLAIVVFYVDALVSLIKVYTVLQFSHFVVQLAVAHVLSLFKLRLVPAWFNPFTNNDEGAAQLN